MNRGRVSVIRDPAIAVAAAKCHLARWRDMKTILGISANSFHPAECGFCDYPADRLAEAVVEFSEWAGLYQTKASDDTLPVRDQVESFLMLPRHEQLRLVEKAQSYDEAS